MRRLQRLLLLLLQAVSGGHGILEVVCDVIIDSADGCMDAW